MKYLLIFIVLAVSISCHIYGPYIPPMPVTPTDNNCPGACQHLRALGCEDGNPLPDGTPCEVFCEETQKAGHALRPSCIMTLTSCSVAEMEKCQTPRNIFTD